MKTTVNGEKITVPCREPWYCYNTGCWKPGAVSSYIKAKRPELLASYQKQQAKSSASLKALSREVRAHSERVSNQAASLRAISKC